MKNYLLLFICTINFIFANANEDLYTAIFNNDYGDVVSAVKKGAKVNPIKENIYDMSPIFDAVNIPDELYFTGILEDIDEFNDFINTKIKIIDFLIQKGANVNDFYNTGGSYNPHDVTLFSTIYDKKIAEHVAKKGVKFKSPLEAAIAKNETEKVKELIKLASNQSKIDSLWLSLRFNNNEYTDLLVKSGMDVYTIDYLYYAVENNSYNFVKLLLEAGVDPNKNFLSEYYNENILKTAVARDNKEIFDLLRKYGAE